MIHRIPARKLFVLFFWIALWQLASGAIHNSILLAGPWDVIRSFFALVPTAEFWRSIFLSFGKITLGFLLAFAAGLFLGGFSAAVPLLKEILEPAVALMKSVPVASFVILALIWAGSANLSVLISFLVVFPILYVNTIAGLSATDPRLLEMARVFSLRPSARLRFIYLPALMPYLTSGCQVALGMSWKSGIAAEVIGVPDHTIGEKLYMAKIYLATPDLLAWTLVIILMSALFERLLLLLLRLTDRAIHQLPYPLLPRPSAAVRPSKIGCPSPAFLRGQGLSKSYGSLSVLKGLNLALDSSRIFCLMGPSGCGKTTLLRLLLGLETADSGSILLESGQTACSSSPSQLRLTAVFQEDRLCESFTPVSNVMLAAGSSLSPEEARRELCCLLPQECLSRPVSTLSGGMKRRTAIVRAMTAPSWGILMDEPFTGLDEATKAQVIAYIQARRRGRLLLISTHQEEDVALLQARLIRL